MEIFIGLENKERGQIFSFSFSRKFNRSTSAHFHITIDIETNDSFGLGVSNLTKLNIQNAKELVSRINECIKELEI